MAVFLTEPRYEHSSDRKKSLKLAQRKMEREILKITLQDHTRKAQIRKRIQIKDISHKNTHTQHEKLNECG